MNSGGKNSIAFALLLSIWAPTTTSAQSFLGGQENLSPVEALVMTSVPEAFTDPLAFDIQVASHSARENRGADRMLFDGETSRFKMRGGYNLNEQWRIQAAIHYQWINKGIADPFIDTWHKVFGLPEGIRDIRPRDVLDFNWFEDGVSVIDVTTRQNGFGDMNVSAHYLGKVNDDGSSWQFNVAAKLPTGSLDSLTGSDAIDVGVGVHWQSTADTRWRWSVGANAVLLGDIDLPLDVTRSVVVSGQVGAVYSLSPNLELGARLQGHSGVYSSDLNNIGGETLQLITGGEWWFTPAWALRITVTEDISVDRSPDVTFRLGFATRR
ncbi:MAG: DUF3187 family protein [Pseudomonadota bacterium]